jgi:hypothetical protein
MQSLFISATHRIPLEKYLSQQMLIIYALSLFIHFITAFLASCAFCGQMHHLICSRESDS